MSLVNYHVHTDLCRHASGSIDEYIAAGIDKGLIEIGFADHAPLPLPDREGFTMSPEETEFYITELEKKKEAYKNRIDLKIGFEVDYPLRESFNKRYFNDNRMDFLIGSCHFLNSWPFDQKEYIDEFNKRDIDKVYLDYYTIIEKLIDSKHFDIIGHFDLVKKFGHRAGIDFTAFVQKIAKKITENNIVAEINTSGLLKPVSEIYPSDKIIKIFYDNNVPVTIGSDAHSPERVDYMLVKTVEKLKKIGYRKIFGFRKRKNYEIII